MMTRKEKNRKRLLIFCCAPLEPYKQQDVTHLQGRPHCYYGNPSRVQFEARHDIAALPCRDGAVMLAQDEGDRLYRVCQGRATDHKMVDGRPSQQQD